MMDLRQHAHQLAQKHDIALMENERLPKHYALASESMLGERAIFMSKITEECTYAVALHEMGHIARRKKFEPGMNFLVASQSIHGMIELITEEKAAWAWAREHALVWTIGMDCVERFALQSYEQRLAEMQAAVGR